MQYVYVNPQREVRLSATRPLERGGVVVYEVDDPIVDACFEHKMLMVGLINAAIAAFDSGNSSLDTSSIERAAGLKV